jgi:uncharacterized membrane protein
MRTVRRILKEVDAPDVIAVIRRQAHLALKDNEEIMKTASDLEDLRREYQQIVTAADRPRSLNSAGRVNFPC